MGTIMIDQIMGVMIDHDCTLGLLEHDPVIEEWVTCEYRVACHFHSWSKMWLKFKLVAFHIYSGTSIWLPEIKES